MVALILLGFAELLRVGGVAGQLARFETPLLTRLLYGGVTEELLTRWGLMSFFVWVAWRIARRPGAVPRWCYWAGALVAALLFAAGHVPLLTHLVPGASAWLIAAVMIGNTVPGLIFGWLFWRRGLESAIIAHGAAHVLAAIVTAAT